MKSYYPLCLLVLVGLLLTSCSPNTPFTHDLLTKLDEAGLDATRVQYYNSDEIILRHLDPSENLDIEDGKVVTKRNRNFDEIVVREETPGKCITLDDNQLDIAFESGRYLEFVRERPSDPTSPYLLKVMKTGKGFNKVAYDEKEFYILPEGEFARLMISKKLFNKIKKEKRYARGIKVK